MSFSRLIPFLCVNAAFCLITLSGGHLFWCFGRNTGRRMRRRRRIASTGWRLGRALRTKSSVEVIALWTVIFFSTSPISDWSDKRKEERTSVLPLIWVCQTTMREAFFAYQCISIRARHGIILCTQNSIGKPIEPLSPWRFQGLSRLRPV
jgi:hypothetical protein